MVDLKHEQEKAVNCLSEELKDLSNVREAKCNFAVALVDVFIDFYWLII